RLPSEDAQGRHGQDVQEAGAGPHDHDGHLQAPGGRHDLALQGVLHRRHGARVLPGRRDAPRPRRQAHLDGRVAEVLEPEDEALRRVQLSLLAAVVVAASPSTQLATALKPALTAKYTGHVFTKVTW